MTPPNHLRRRLLSILALAALLFLTACPLPAPAQIPSGYVQTTATVPALANGSFGASWTNLSSSPQLALLGCVSTFQQTVSGSFSAYGGLTVLLADTSQICPSPSTWIFTLTFSCPVGQKASSFMVQVPIVGGGGTEDISTQITAALPATSCSGGGGGGGNLTGTGTPGYIPLWTGASSLGNSPADYGVRTAATFTFPNPVDVGTIPVYSAHIGPQGVMSASWNLDTTTPATALASLGGTQAPNTVWAGPCGGGSGIPAFRSLCTADIPAGVIPVTYYQTDQTDGSPVAQAAANNFSSRFNLAPVPGATDIDLATTGVTPATYFNITATVDAYGRITSASSAGSASTLTDCLTVACAGGVTCPIASTYAAGTTYTNCAGYPVTEMVTMTSPQSGAGGDSSITAFLSGSSGPANGVWNQCNGVASVTFRVPPGGTFSVSVNRIDGCGSGAVSITSWKETTY